MPSRISSPLELMVTPHMSDVTNNDRMKFLLQISDRLIDEPGLSGLALKLALLILNMMQRMTKLVFFGIPTLKSLLLTKNSNQIKNALDQLENFGFIQLRETKTKKRRVTYYYKTRPALRAAPFFSLYSDLVAPTQDGKKCPGPIMSLSNNELRLLLWLHRYFSRMQISGSCFREWGTGHMLMSFDSERCTKELGFRNFHRLLDGLQNAGFIINDGFTTDASRRIKLINAYIKDSVECKLIFPKETSEPAHSGDSHHTSKLPHFGLAIPTSFVANGQIYEHPRESCLLMASDPGLEKDLIAYSQDLGFTHEDHRGFRKLIRKYGPFLVDAAVKVSAGEGTTMFPEIRRRAEKLSQNGEIEFHEPCRETDDFYDPLNEPWDEEGFDDCPNEYWDGEDIGD